ALFVLLQVLDLLRTQPGLLTDGLVVVQSVMAAVELARLEVGQLAQLRGEVAGNGLLECQRRPEHLGGVAGRAEGVGHHPELGLDLLKQTFRGVGRLGVGEGGKVRHDDLLWTRAGERRTTRRRPTRARAVSSASAPGQFKAADGTRPGRRYPRSWPV